MGGLLREEPKDKGVGKSVIKESYKICRYMPIWAVEFRLLVLLYKHSTEFVYSKSLATLFQDKNSRINQVIICHYNQSGRCRRGDSPIFQGI